MILEKMPKEIKDFLYDVFEMYEIRGRVGEDRGVSFYVRSNETCHSIPHVHAQYGEYQISIAIEDSRVLAGNIPSKNLKLAQEWVQKNKDKLLTQWKNYTISAQTFMQKSKFDD